MNNINFDPIDLTQALVRCPSVTHSDNGALDIVENHLTHLDFRCTRLPFSETNYDNVDNLIYGTDNDGVTYKVTSGGDTYQDGDHNSGTADYAEYFESKSGSAIAIGSTVKLDGDKIVACSEGDTPIGVVRPKWSSSVVCGAAPLRWAGKYLKDDYDEVQMEEYSHIRWTEEVDSDKYHSRHPKGEEYSKVEGS